jgi:hypothetical protein
VSRGGSNNIDNLITTSTTNNTAKGTALLVELSWTIKPILGDNSKWDGLTKWFIEYIKLKPELLEDKTINGWYKALIQDSP